MNFKILLLSFAIAVLLPGITAASSNIDINVSQAVHYIKGPQNIALNFNFINLRDDDSTIDRVDFYILDLKSQNIDFIAYNGSSWQREYLAKFDDDHFWITSASGQSLAVTVKPNFTAEGTYDIQGYYQFFDQTGSMVGLGDNRPLFPLVDVVDHVFAKIIIDNTAPAVSLIGEPSWASEGLKIQASINDSNPIGSVKLSYNSPAGSKTVDANYSTAAKTANAVIPLSDIKEGEKLNFTITAVDAAGNSGSASGSFDAKDNPQINNVYPSTLLPQTLIKIFAKITDSSGVKDASVKFTQNSKNEKTISMLKGANDFWSADLGNFEKGTKIDYTINASDTLGNPSTATGFFTVLNEYNVKFNVIDEVLKSPVENVTLVVSSRTVSTAGSSFVIPEKTMTFNGSKTFTQFEGPYYFTFSTPKYPEHKYLFDIQSDFEKTIMLGTGARSEIKNAQITPRLSDTNKNFYLDIKAEVQEAYPAKTLKLKYSINSSLYDSEIELSKKGSEYYAVLGLFEKEIVLYSKLELIDASEQVITFDLGIRWYSLLLSTIGTNIGVEICGNAKDDNNNGLIDEGCPCKEKDTQTCSKNIGICKIGVQKCLNGKWSETCDGGIIPVPEVCGNELDDDCDNAVDNGCFVDSDNDGLSDEQEKKLGTNPRNPDTDEDNVSDGQEFLKDDTNALDAKSNLLYVDLKSSLSLGDTQEIRLFHSKLGVIPGIEALTLAPSGTESRHVAGNSGVISFKPSETGNYYAKVSKKKFEAVKEFSVSTGIFSVSGAIGSSVSFIFGETATETPLYLLFLLVLCTVIAFTANSQYRHFSTPSKKVLSSSEEKKELIKRTVFVIAAAVIPLIILRISDAKTGFQNSVLSAFALIIILLGIGFALSKARMKKGIKVEEKKETKGIFGKITSSIKGLFFEEKQAADIKPAGEWKKIDWALGGKPEEKQAASVQAAAEEKTQVSETSFQYQTPASETNASATSSFEQPESLKSVEVWKRFEPVEFEDRMVEIGKEVEKSLEKKLLEVGDEIEARVGKKLLEVEEEVDRRVSRRLLETEEVVERKLSRKLAEVEEDVDRKLKKRMQEMEEDIGREIERKLSAEHAKQKTLHKKASIERLKKQALMHKILHEELQKSSQLQSQAAAQQTGFTLKETKQPTALSLQKPESLQPLSKAVEEKMQELTKQLAVLNQAFEKGLISQSEFESESSKIKAQLAEVQKK